jgi:hypothetical protein
MFEQNVINGPGTGTFTEHTLEIFIMLFGAFLLGLWLGWMLWSKYKQAAEKLALDNQSLTASADAMRAELALAKTAAANAEADRSNYATQVETLHRNNGNLRDQLDQLEASMESLSARNRQLETEMGLSLDPHARTVENPIPLEVDHLDFSGADEPEHDFEMEQPAEQDHLPTVEFELTPLLQPTETPVDATEEDLNFSDEIPDETAFVPENEENTQFTIPAPTVVPIPLLHDEAETELAGMAPVEDLAQISAFDIDETKSIQEPPAPIQVIAPTPTQAIPTELPPISVPPLETVPFAAFSDANDDLTVVEGIGPKIQELLNQFGIRSYQQLAETDVNRLKEILSSAGSQLAMHDPGTWPAQANLAANDQWDNLKAIQGFLKGGKKPD